MLGVHANYETASDASGSIILLQEYNHRMLNEYAVAIAGLSLAASTIKSSKDRAAVTTARDRLFAIAEMHRALQAPMVGVVEVMGYVERICGAAARAFTFGRRLVLRRRDPGIAFPAPDAWRIGLIVNELVTNAAKHGHPTADIVVEMRHLGQHFLCLVANEGCVRSARGSGAGNAIVDVLADQIGARLERQVDGARVAVALLVPDPRPIILDNADTDFSG